MIVSPLGEVLVLIDEKIVQYETDILNNIVCGYSVDARYIFAIPLQRNSTVSILIEGNPDCCNRSNDQDLEVAELYKGDIKLCIGITGDIPGVTYQYQKKGVELIITDKCNREFVTCVIVWKKIQSDEDDFGCWLAADSRYQ